MKSGTKRNSYSGMLNANAKKMENTEVQTSPYKVPEITTMQLNKSITTTDA